MPERPAADATLHSGADAPMDRGADAPMDRGADAPMDTECPRCRERVAQRFYGPCDACRAQLRATIVGETREVAAEAFVPKMNVTPNAVAVKD